jgi:hypothetical protein
MSRFVPRADRRQHYLLPATSYQRNNPWRPYSKDVSVFKTLLATLFDRIEGYQKSAGDLDPGAG